MDRWRLPLTYLSMRRRTPIQWMGILLSSLSGILPAGLIPASTRAVLPSDFPSIPVSNLDPGAVLAPLDVMKREASAVLESAGGRAGHIFNLGHGIMPQADVDQVRRLVDHVHEASAR